MQTAALTFTLVLANLLAGLPVHAGDAARAWTEQGLRHLHGEGVARDVDRAVVYLCAAATHRDADAAFELGWLYLQGRGVARNESLAVGWFDRAQGLGASVPAALLDRLESVEASSPACIASDGHDLALTSRRRADFAVTIFELAPSYGLDPKFVLEVVRAESNFNPRARSHKGALGLMQLIPATARRFGVEDPFEPVQNLRGGMAYLRWLLNHFDGDIELALAGYNAGEQAVKRFGGVPPYNETRDYVRRILRRYGGSRA
jgi:soluble lytic murein transglycosylase-like protein